jgi:excinuclease ABC subunit A
MQPVIEIVNAHEHNLKHIDVVIPKNKLVVVTGVSGSGKSSLIFDTLQKECQRHYLESIGLLNEEFEKPRYGHMSGLSPSISVSQHQTNRNPRSTVGTMTDLYGYLRLIYAKAGQQLCPHCREWTLAGDGSRQMAALCLSCGGEVPNLGLPHFSFNKPQGACPTCKGLGEIYDVRLEEVLDRTKSIREGAIGEWDIHYIKRNTEVFANAGAVYGLNFDLGQPVERWSEAERDFLLFGAGDERFIRHRPDANPPATVLAGRFEGLIPNLKRRYSESGGQPSKRAKLARFFHTAVCPDCGGKKLNVHSRAVQVAGRPLGEVSGYSLEQLARWAETLQLAIVQPVVEELKQTLRKLLAIRLGYLTLDRVVVTLSGGEHQRFRLASLLQSGMTGVLYILDEPTIGLHAKDTGELLRALRHLRDLGNTVIVIEHDPDVIKEADWVIEIGPLAGRAGGEVLNSASIGRLLEEERSQIRPFLLDKLQLKDKPPSMSGAIEIRGASCFNLKSFDVQIPVQALTTVTGVSGSGKSSLIFEVLAKGEGTKAVKGLEQFAAIQTIEQAPIGKSSRSNAATYTDVFTPIRRFYAGLARHLGLPLAEKDFSFNAPGGRCETCEGLGVIATPMHFMPDVETVCPVCDGDRYQAAVLAVKHQGMNINDVLRMSVDDAVALFAGQKRIVERLQVLQEVGLGYLPLGQPAPTLSGGEAERIKIARELGVRSGGPTLYLMDEPTTGLHPLDVAVLLRCIHKLLEHGHTVIAIEHHLGWIAASDWLIDLGPEGGERGGHLLACGTPRQVVAVTGSATGEVLRDSQY